MQTYRHYLLETEEFDSPYKAVEYAEKLRKRVPELEDLIKTHPGTIVKYAKNVIHGRWPEAEKILLDYPLWSLEYAAKIIGNRWPEAEDKLWDSQEDGPDRWGEYSQVGEFASDEQKIQWIFDPRFNIDYTMDILNRSKMSKDVQESLIQKRPDLITKIRHLDPELKAKYAHEIGLGSTDI